MSVAYIYVVATLFPTGFQAFAMMRVALASISKCPPSSSVILLGQVLELRAQPDVERDQKLLGMAEVGAKAS